MDLLLASSFPALGLWDRGTLCELTAQLAASSPPETLLQNGLTLQSTACELKRNTVQVRICKCFLNGLGPRFHKISNHLVALCLYILEEYSDLKAMYFVIRNGRICLQRRHKQLYVTSQYRWILILSSSKELSQKCAYKSICQNSETIFC